jgi:hypothetical protein
MRSICYVVLVLLFLSSCSSVAGLRDKSYTIDNHDLQANAMESLTILPIKDDSAVLGLSGGLEAELSKAIHVQMPQVKIVNADAFRSRIAENDLINEYAQWKSAYDETKMLSLRPLKKWSQIVETRYFLMVVKVHLSREKMTAIDTGYSGWVNNASNVWRTDLRLFAQVIDVESGTVTWKGVGHAENVHSPKRIGNDGWITWNAKNPETDQYIRPMIKVAVDGLVMNITAGGQSAINPR